MRTVHSVALTTMLALLLSQTVTQQRVSAGSPPQSPGAEIVRSAALSWVPSELPRVELAVVSGDPAKAGEIFVLRVRMQNDARFPVHTHPGAENVTVIKGTLLVGIGDEFDAAKGQALAVGDFVRIPGGLRHFAQANGEVVIEVSGLGPFAIQYVNPADVPAKAPPKAKP